MDVVPTLLYFLGLPIGRDMDGYARTDLFQRTFTDERPIYVHPDLRSINETEWVRWAQRARTLYCFAAL